MEFQRQLLRPFVLFENIERPSDDDFRSPLQFAAAFKRALTHVAGTGDDGKGIFYGCV
ncbi:hypothetical protein CFBP5877_06825 [Agrobacterium tumefaciens]|uniref:Uncharacterized protein n=1 Tax=Agrobacterium tumefaciens TaxID=358 RepID=A0AAE6BFX4_AGRTU|nr:hypothetical protein CFBP5499_07295 [Agrobacterium tumefaciens]QCL80279.1 hypothetical protein CFBP5877_06825 [Agrobacterium tumefaciens]